MTTIRVKHKIAGYRAVRYSGPVEAFLEGVGRRVMSTANAQLKGGKGFAMSSRPGARRPQGRHRVSVAAITPYAQRANAKRNILLRSLSG
jgi:hypothetical protein